MMSERAKVLELYAVMNENKLIFIVAKELDRPIVTDITEQLRELLNSKEPK